MHKTVLKYFGVIAGIVGQCALTALALTICYNYIIQGVFPNLIDIPFKGWFGLVGGLFTLKHYILSYFSFNSDKVQTHNLYTAEGLGAILTWFLNQITYIISLFVIAGIIALI